VNQRCGLKYPRLNSLYGYDDDFRVAMISLGFLGHNYSILFVPYRQVQEQTLFERLSCDIADFFVLHEDLFGREEVHRQ
jgi:hypothetical protein